jgi:hypothetical protein
MSRIKRVIYGFAAAVGLVAATVGPATAGTRFGNHTEPAC